MKKAIKIELCTYSKDGVETWIVCPSVKALSDYFTSGNYYRQALRAVKNRETFFRGYKIRYASL